MAADSLLGLAAWRPRSKEFGALQAYDDGRPIVVMEFDPNEPDRLEGQDAQSTFPSRE